MSAGCMAFPIQSIDPEKLTPGGHWQQSAFWGRFKALSGMRPYAFTVDGRPLLTLYRPLKGRWGLLYIPAGPDIAISTPEANAAPWEAAALMEIGRAVAGKVQEGVREKVVFVRFDPLWPLDTVDSRLVRYARPLRKARLDVQMPDTTILDITPSEEALLKGMKSKTRYNIRLAAKRGVVVSTDNTRLKEWYELYKITAKRDGIAIHSLTYYENLFRLSAEDETADIRLMTAAYEGELLAGIIVSFYGDTATYLYGASSNAHREKMPAYLLQWEAIKAARSRGCSAYDFFGIPPTNDPAHPSHGLYRFKLGFGGAIVHRPGSWDLPVRPLLYRLYTAAERMRVWYYKKWKKRKH